MDSILISLSDTRTAGDSMQMISNSRNKGQSLVELSVGLMFMIPILYFMLNCLFVAIGASLNESVCRDAARAAASGAPSIMRAGNRTVTNGTPKDRVLSVINKVYYSGLPMKVRQSVKIVELVRDVPPASEGGAIDGEVTVTTTIDIYPPVQVQGMGNVVLKSKHSVPITYMRRADS